MSAHFHVTRVGPWPRWRSTDPFHWTIMAGRKVDALGRFQYSTGNALITEASRKGRKKYQNPDYHLDLHYWWTQGEKSHFPSKQYMHPAIPTIEQVAESWLLDWRLEYTYQSLDIGESSHEAHCAIAYMKTQLEKAFGHDWYVLLERTENIHDDDKLRPIITDWWGKLA